MSFSLLSIGVLLLIAEAQTVPSISANPDLIKIQLLLEEHDWNRARKMSKRLATSTAKKPETPNESEWLAELCRLRAVSEAGAGNARLADWYWWVSKLFGEDFSISDLNSKYGKGGEALSAFIRDPLKQAVVREPQGKPLRTQFKRKEGTRPAFFRSACRDLSGFVTFALQIAEDSYYQAPQPIPLQPLTHHRPLCVFAVLEGYRDRRIPGATLGSTHRINEQIDITRRH